MRMLDSLRSFVAGLGTSRDKMATVEYGFQPLNDHQLITAYRSSWIAKKIINIPVFDSFRKWRNWQADAPDIEKIEAEERRLGLRSKLVELHVKARLFGGAALYMGTNSDPSLPFDPQRERVEYLTVFPRRVLNVSELNRDISSEWYNQAEWYELSIPGTDMLRIHASRLVVAIGNELPDPELVAAGTNYGWGDSVLQATLSTIQQADATLGNIASLVFEAKVDVVKIPNLMQSLATCPPGSGYEDELLRRFRLAGVAKGINGMLVLDKDEDYSQKSASFQTLPDLALLFLQVVSGAADIPFTRFLGYSPSGLAATGEHDLRNYYDRLSSDQELRVDPALYRLNESLIWGALGARPSEIFYNWASLWQISDKEKSEIGKIAADTVATINNTGLFPPEALAATAVNTFTEYGVLPGLQSAIDDAGGFDFGEDEPPPVEDEPPVNEELTDAEPRSLYIQRKVLNADEIIAWAKSQGIETTLPPEALHVTIAYSRQRVDWLKVGEPWEELVTINAGGPRVVEELGTAIVLSFSSRTLSYRHKDVLEAGASWDHDGYTPHVTLTYQHSGSLEGIEPFQGRIELGPEIFEELNEGWRPENEV